MRESLSDYRLRLSGILNGGTIGEITYTAHKLAGLCAQFGAVRAGLLAALIEAEPRSIIGNTVRQNELLEVLNLTDKAFADKAAAATSDECVPNLSR